MDRWKEERRERKKRGNGRTVSQADGWGWAMEEWEEEAEARSPRAAQTGVQFSKEEERELRAKLSDCYIFCYQARSSSSGLNLSQAKN